MTETRPTGEQLRFVSENTGEHILDAYLEAAEKGGRTVPDMLADIYDPSTGLFRTDLFEFRVTSGQQLQFRVGDFPDLVTGWRNVEGNPFLFFEPRGTWAQATVYAQTDLVRYQNATYYALSAHTSTSTFDPTKWSPVLDDTELDAAIAAAAASASAAAASQSAAASSATSASGSASTATTKASEASASASAAATSATNAATSASNAATSETNANTSKNAAATSATNAAASASTASTQASSASTSATNAANSATAAAGSASSASTSATNAASSATSADTSKTAAATSETNAANSATAAANSATAAQTSATNAASSATSANTSKNAAAASETAAAGSASSAATSETNAAASASTATTKAGEAATSATSAANSASAASTSASAASTSATSASNSASAASTSAGNAATSATSASNSASAASTSATNASNSASAASTSATNAAASAAAALAAEANTIDIFDQFGDQYLGPKTSDPTLDNDGNALTNGAVYWNTTNNTLRFYNGTTWVAPETVATTAATNASNSATAAATSATNAASSASAASTSASNAASSASSAGTSATDAANSATSASNSAATATTQATNAATSETNAAASASSASTSASTATTKASDAANSATAAATSATSASASASTATTKASEASASATTAANEATDAAASAAAAALSEADALSHANDASTSATLANDWATKTSSTVAGGEWSAKYHAQQAATSASNAASSASSAASIYDDFDDRYLGAKSSNPTTDNDGNALAEGTLYWNTTIKEMRLWDGTSWISLSSAGGASYLDDLADVSATTPSVDDTLVFDGTNWTKKSATEVVSTVDGYATFANSGNISLTSSSPRVINVTGTSTTNIILYLPDVATLTVGRSFVIINSSSGSVSVRAYNASLANTVVLIPAANGLAVVTATVRCLSVSGNVKASFSPTISSSLYSGTGNTVLLATNPTIYGPRQPVTEYLTAGADSQGSFTISTDIVWIMSSSNPGGVTLPAVVSPGSKVTVINRTANTVNVYPSSGQAINYGTADAPFALDAGGAMDFISYSYPSSGYITKFINVPVSLGGTGATTASAARTNLGLAIGTNVQAWGADLDAIAALSGTSGFLKKTAANTWTLDTSTYGALATSNVWTGGQDFGDGTGSYYLDINGAAGQNRALRVKTAGVTRWTFNANTSAETGSNAGSDFELYRHDDAGTYIDTPWQISRATGNMHVKSLTLTTDLAVTQGGTGASDAATARTNLGAAAASHTHAIADITSLQATLDAKTAFPAGTRMLFQQTSAPTGWTKDTTHNDKALRVVSGTVGSGGSTAFSSVFASRTVSGTTANTTSTGSMSQVYTYGSTDQQTPAVTVGNTTLSWNEMPAHSHTYSGGLISNTTATGTASRVNNLTGTGTSGTSSSSGSSWAHGHSASQASHYHGVVIGLHDHTLTMNAHNHTYSSTLDMAVQYVDLIIAQKD